MRMQRAWDSFWGALGFVRRNRRQRHGAAARRRSLRRRHQMDSLEQRVVLNADPVATDDDYLVGPAQISTADYAPITTNDLDGDLDELNVRFDANPLQNVTLDGGETYSWTYTVGDRRGGMDTGRVQVTAEGTPTAPPFAYVESTGLRENATAHEIKIRLSHAAGESITVDWQLQQAGAVEGEDYLGVWRDGFTTQEWQPEYETGTWIEEGYYDWQWVENWVNHPYWVDDQYDEFGVLVEPGYWQDDLVDEGSYQETWVSTGYWQYEWVEGYWYDEYHEPGYYNWGTVEFAPGETEKTLQLYVVGDGQSEPEESLTVVLTGAVGADVRTWSHGTVTILDNAQPVALDDDYTLVLPVGFTSGEVDLSEYVPILDGDDYDFDGDTVQLHHSNNPGTVEVTAGQTIPYTYSISDGNGGYATATVRIHVVAGANAPPAFTPGGDLHVNAAQGFVVVDDWATTISPGSEGEQGQTLTFEVYVDDPAEQTLFAELPRIEPDGTLWFTSSGLFGTAQVRVVLRDDGGTDNGGMDTSVEHLFTITFYAPASGGGGGGGGGEEPVVPTIGFAAESELVTVAEDVAAGKASFVIMLSEAVDHAVAVHWQAVADTGHAGTHFESVGGTAVFAAGQTSCVVEVPILDDGEDHGSDRTFRVVLTDAIGGEIAEGAVAQGTILEDDVNVTISDAAAVEGAGDGVNPVELVFVVTLSRACEHDVTIDYSTEGITADTGDFQSASGSLTFLAGETTKEIRIALVNDHENTLDPNNSDYRIGELLQQMKVVLSSSDPHVMIARPYGIGNIGDDDWQHWDVVDPDHRAYFERTYSGTEYAPGDVISLDPFCVGLNGGLYEFVVPENWTGGTFWESYIDPIYGWLETSPAEPSLPLVSLETVDVDAVHEGGMAKFRFTVTNLNAGDSVTVHYATHALTAASGDDFMPTTGSYSFYADGTYDVDVALELDELTEPVEEFMLYATSISGAILTEALFAKAMITQPVVKSVKFMNSAESSATTGELVPDSTVFGADNYRFFPDAHLGEAEGRNVVRVRAVVDGLHEGDRVYFMAYDVDDASRADMGDKDAPQGNDNFGRLDLTLDGGGITGGHHLPGDPGSVGGFAGLVRGVGADGTAHVWHGYPGDLMGGLPLVSGIVRRDFISGEYYAEADLLVSFQPGDNFRVVAIPQPEPNNPDWDPNDGQIRQEIRDAFDEIDFANAQPADQPQTYGAAASGTLTVWRYLNLEVDQMTPSNGQALGDTAAGTIAENLGMTGSHGWRFALAVDANSPVLFNKNSLEGGILRIGGENFEILSSTAKVDGRVEVIVKRDVGRNLILEQFDVGAAVTMYEDDFHGPTGVAPAPTLRIDMSVDLRADALKYLQSSFRADQNKLAEAFIMPRYDVLAAYSGDLSGRNHWEPNWTNDDALTMGGTTAPQNGSRDLGSDVFWTSYLGIAYQYAGDRDFDADAWLNGAQNPDGDEALGGENPYAPPLSVQSETTDGESFRNSVVFVESIWDNWTAHRELSPDHPLYAEARSAAAQLARAVIHEIGSQFWLGSSAGIMDFQPMTVREADFSFIVDDLMALRRWPQPGQNYA